LSNLAPLASVIVLALIQGLCEFLPVSSSGHLVLAQAYLGFIDPDIVFDLVLHLGTLAAVIFYYRQTLAGLISELRLLPKALISPSILSQYYQTRPDFRLGILIIAASLATAVLGLTFRSFLTSLFSSIRAVGLALLLTSAVLALTALVKPGCRAIMTMRLSDALIIGLAQGFAIAPGLSRSGLTIAAALILGLNKQLAAKFSFIASIPAILGGLILSLSTGMTSPLGLKYLLVGLIVAAISGYLALKLLTVLIDRGRLPLFAPWCLLAGLAALFYINK
jgi:undecaprenyl-diphosphatase